MTMTKYYQHTQRGRLLPGLLAAGLAVTAFLTLITGLNPVGMAACLVLAGCVAEFRSLTVTVDQEAVRVRFGLGLLRHSFPLADIRAARPIRVHWYDGIGIHFTSHGLLYNVGGLDAVEIELPGDRRASIGTDDPAALATAIQGGIMKM
jgi:hypothetical protein